MKKIENFGDLILSNLGLVFMAIGGAWLVMNIYVNMHSVTISDKEFRCAEASPDGLGTKCDTYIRRVK